MPANQLPNSEERQVATTFDGIRADHLHRYNWATKQFRRHTPSHVAGANVVDLGCGIGYGSFIMALANNTVLGLDCDEVTLEYARTHWNIQVGIGSTNFQHLDLSHSICNDAISQKDIAVAFEVIEHLRDPLPLLAGLKAKTLYASAPNEEVFPYKNYKYHFRHYTRAEFESLLNEAGWTVNHWWGQLDETSDVERDINGRTLIAVCERSKPPFKISPASATTEALEDLSFQRALDDVTAKLSAHVSAHEVEPYRHPTGGEPKTVMLCGLGPSKYELIELMVQHDFVPSWDELWTVNKGISILPRSDVAFIMDDVVDYANKHPAYGREMSAYSGEIIGQTAFPAELKAMGLNYSEFPLRDVLHFWGGNVGNWLHTISLGYILAYAGAIGVKRLFLTGVDCSWPGRPDLTEAGNAVVCYWIGRLESAGCEVIINSQSVLNSTHMRGRYEWRKFYGYLRQPEE